MCVGDCVPQTFHPSMPAPCQLEQCLPNQPCATLSVSSALHPSGLGRPLTHGLPWIPLRSPATIWHKSEAWTKVSHQRSAPHLSFLPGHWFLADSQLSQRRQDDSPKKVFRVSSFERPWDASWSLVTLHCDMRPPVLCPAGTHCLCSLFFSKLALETLTPKASFLLFDQISANLLQPVHISPG